MQLDPEKRYLLSRPRGGFNDMLVQIEKSLVYAKKYDRVLILDTSGSGLREPIDSLFSFTQDVGVEVHVWREEMDSFLDSLTSVSPACVTHRISSYNARWSRKHTGNTDDGTGDFLSFDHGCDHPEQLLLHDQPGGGQVALRILGRLRLHAHIADVIVARLEHLGRGYDAVHIRHSDYKTKFRRFFLLLRPVLHKRRLLVCSDNVAAIAAAQKILHPSTLVLSVSDIPDLKGKPLHRTDLVDVRAANIDLLCDLIAMALSDRLFFPRLSGFSRRKARYSGFSVLAEMLRRNRVVVRELLSNASAPQLQMLFEVVPQLTGRRRKIQLWGQEFIGRLPSRLMRKIKLAESDTYIPPERM